MNTWLGSLIFGFACAESLFANPALDSARVAESAGLMGEALEHYEAALEVDSLSTADEIEIREILQAYYENLGLSEDAQANAQRLAQLDGAILVPQDSVQNVSHPETPLESSSEGWYANMGLGLSSWTRTRKWDTLSSVGAYVDLNTGWRIHSHDFSVGTGISLDRIKSKVQGYSPSQTNQPGFPIRADYAYDVEWWGLSMGVERALSLTREVNKKVFSQSQVTVDTLVTSQLSAYFQVWDLEDHAGTVNAALSVVTRRYWELSAALSARKYWGDFSLGWGLKSVWSQDLFNNQGLGVYSTDIRGAGLTLLAPRIQDLSVALPQLPGAQYTVDSLTYGQANLRWTLNPRWGGAWGYFELGQQLSLGAEIQTERYFKDANGNLYTGDAVYSRPESSYYGFFAASADTGLIYEARKINAYENRAGWLNWQVRPTLVWRYAEHWSLSAAYTWSTDLWRQDYILSPQGPAAFKYGTNSVSLSLSSFY